MSTATFTDLLRKPKDVVERTEQGAVRITRRDAEDLVLVRAGDLEGQRDGIALASRIMRAAFHTGGNMRLALEDAFAWTHLLSEDARTRMAAEIDRLVWSSTELGEYGALLGTFRSWEGTAEALAAGLSADATLDWIDASQWTDVERPA